MTHDEAKLEAAEVLLAYQHVLDHGTRVEGAHLLDGVRATSDTDDYTVALSDGATTVRVLFHNRLSIDAPNRTALETFARAIRRINEHARLPPRD